MRRISEKAFLSLLCLLWPALCFSQAAKKDSVKTPHPDFSGTWAFDKTESKVNRRDPLSRIEMNLFISHHEPELKVTRRIAAGDEEKAEEFFYYTDGRTENIPSLSANIRYRCKSGWDKAKLVSKCTLWFKFPSKGEEIPLKQELTEKWELSSDGQMLTQRIVYSQTYTDSSQAFQNLPPAVREGAQRERRVREILQPPNERRRVFRRVP